MKTKSKFILLLSLFLIWFLQLNCSGRSTTELLNGETLDQLQDSTAPSILSPQVGSTIGLNIVLQWTAKAGATNYTIDITTDAAFSQIISGSPFIIDAPNTTFSTDLSAVGGNTYYWRVRADTTTSGQYGQSNFNAIDNILYVYCSPLTSNCSAANSGSVGTKSNPYKTIAFALSRAVVLGSTEIRVAARDTTSTTYNEAIIIKDGISIYGGYNSNFSIRDVSIYKTVVSSTASYVAFARDISQTTVVDGFTFNNTSTGLSTTFGVKTDNCTNSLSFNNVSMNGGNGTSAYGLNNVNFSSPQLNQVAITTGANSTVKTSVGVYNQSGSLPTIQKSIITTAGSAATHTKGIYNVDSEVVILDSNITASDATNSSYGIFGGSFNVSTSMITSGLVSQGAGIGISAKKGTIQNSTIQGGDNFTEKIAISLCDPTALILSDIQNNLIDGRVSLCNDWTTDTITVSNNTILFNNINSKSGAIEIKNNVTTMAQLKLQNNIIANYGSSILDTGIKIGNTNLTNLNDNLFHTANLIQNESVFYNQTCSALETTGTGTFETPKEFVNRTTANGLGHNNINDVVVVGNNVYAATDGGISISTDGGVTFVNKTTAQGLPVNLVTSIAVVGTNIYAGTASGLAVSTDGGTSFTTKTTVQGLSDDNIRSVAASGTNVYVASGLAVSISADSGTSFIVKTLTGTPAVRGIFYDSSKIYATTANGLHISTDGGLNFTQFNTGLPSTNLNSKFYVNGVNIYVQRPGIFIAKSTDGGANFTDVTAAFGSNNISSFFLANSTLYTSANGLSISNDNGVNFITKTSEIGFGSNSITKIFVSSSKTYLATSNGLSISNDIGHVFTNKTTAQGLGVNNVYDVFVAGQNVYTAELNGGFSLSTDEGISFTNKTTSDGLGSNLLFGVFSESGIMYAATALGLSISTDGGTNFINKTTTNGLGNNLTRDVHAIGKNVYVATNGGLSISTDSGNNFVNKTTGNGLGSDTVNGVFVDGTNVYVATSSGLSISTDSGTSFTNKTTTDNLVNNNIQDVFVVGSNVYVATLGGVSISTDGGTTFSTSNNATTSNGLGHNNVFGIFVLNSVIYAATKGGVSISHDLGKSYLNKTTAQGLGNNEVHDVVVVNNKLYAGTIGGLSISTFENKCTSLFTDTGAGTPTGNQYSNKISGINSSGAIFDSTIFDLNDTSTWQILGSGPADKDLSGGYTVGDVGANPTTSGVTTGVVPGVSW